MSKLTLDYSRTNYASLGMSGHLPQTEEDAVRGYTVSPWKKLIRFCCCVCPEDNFNEADMQLHVFSRHHKPDAPVTRPPTMLLFDGSGKQITEIPIAASVAAETAPPVTEELPKVMTQAEADEFLNAALPDLILSGIISTEPKKKKGR